MKKRIITLTPNKYTNFELKVILKGPLHGPATDSILKMYISFTLK